MKMSPLCQLQMPLPGVVPRQIAPFRLPVDCIEFDMRQLQLSCNSAFPGAQCTITTVRIRPRFR